MSTKKEFVDHIIEQLAELGDVYCRSMMGEYIVYYGGKIAAYVCDNRLLVKPVESAKALMADPIYEPPYAGAKDMLLVEDVDDKDFLLKLFRAMYDELPAPKPKKKK